jgi:hypothetical protein
MSVQYCSYTLHYIYVHTSDECTIAGRKVTLSYNLIKVMHRMYEEPGSGKQKLWILQYTSNENYFGSARIQTQHCGTIVAES